METWKWTSSASPQVCRSRSTVVTSQHKRVTPERSMLKEIQHKTASAPLTG